MNAKDEFLEHVAEKEVKCCYIYIEDGFNYDTDSVDTTAFVLKKNFKPQDFNTFLKSIDFNYNDGYGAQKLFGYIWYTDGTYSERGEYDGSEWWEHKESPSIPEECK